MTRSPLSLVGRAVIVAALLSGCGLKTPPSAAPHAVGAGAVPAGASSPTPSPAAAQSSSPEPLPASPSAPVAASTPAAAPQQGAAEPSEPAGPPPSPEDPESLALPTHGSPPDRLAALWRGARLQADPGMRCLWLVDSIGERHAALWPVGYRADLRQVQVTDEQGRLVWASGRARDIGGGYSTVHVERIPPACRTGTRAWWVFLDG